MIIFERLIEPKIKDLLFKKRVILIFGPRQAGKTTLAKKIVSEYGEKGEYFNCENANIRKHFVLGNPEALKELVKDKKIVVFDEAQTILNIGSILKVFVDTYDDVQIIATGSSSFDLANKINEPLTGRSFEFVLYPLSLEEIKKAKNISKNDLLEYMRLGLYPAIVGEESILVKENLLKNITTNYLYKDIYVFESIRNPQIFEDLIKLLAHQIGQLVSVYELAQSLKTSRTTIEKYLKLLEQSYIIKKVRPFSNNHRNELRKAFKIFFIDLGVRNVVADEMEDIDLNIKKGNIFENLFFLELLKKGNLETFSPNIYFWRTTDKDKLEIDFVETKNKNINAYECKWGDEEVVFTKFKKMYKDAKTFVVNPQNILNL